MPWRLWETFVEQGRAPIGWGAHRHVEQLTPREREVLQALVFALRHGVVEIG